MKPIVTFDCYGTLLDTAPVRAFIQNTAEENGLNGNEAFSLFTCYEDRLMYGESFMPYEKLLAEVLSYCDMQLGTGAMRANFENLLNVYNTLQPFDDVKPALSALKSKAMRLL